MEDMFHDASSFNQDVSEWNVSNVSLMFNVWYVFTSCLTMLAWG